MKHQTAKAMTLLLCGLLSSKVMHAKEPFTGIFLSLKAGGDLLTGKHKYETVGGANESTLRKIGISYGFGLGYMKLAPSKVLWGGEVYYEGRSLKAKQKMATVIDEGELTVSHKNAMGLSGMVGMAANPKLVAYGKFSLESNSFELNFKNLARGAENKKITKRTLGMLPGTGLLYRLSDSILVGMEYSFAVLKEIKTTPGTITSTYSPAENRLSTNVRWLF
jgi:opacity protein-like surface antigen